MWFKKAEGGDDDAQTRLAKAYENGKLDQKREACTRGCTCRANLAYSARCWSRYLILPTCMRRAYLNWRLGRPKENSKQKKRGAYTQVHMSREPGLLCSVLIMALDLAHVHVVPANSALFLPRVSLFCFEFSLGRSGKAP